MSLFEKKFSRRKFLGTLGICGLSTVSYANIESDWLDVGHYRVPVSKTQDRAPLRILHLSDLHASHFVSLDFIHHAVELGLKQKPDLICLTGDYITHKCDHFDPYSEILAELPKVAPTVATLGNHDGGWYIRGKMHGYESTKEVRRFIEKSNIQLLDNEQKTVRIRDWNLNLVGMGDYWAREFDPAKAFKNVSTASDTVRIALSHNPDTKDPLKEYPWDVMLSGHTHGGQVSLPLIGTPFAPVKDRRFIKGLHRWDNRWIYITRGVGNLFGVRVHCRPEVSVLTLV